jgi:pimeloyl-ACP methyl ester carboxylesterase
MRFTPSVADADIADLRERLARTRWPSPPTDASQGLSLERVQALAERWRSDFDWKRYRERLTALPQVRVDVDGLATHAIHVRSERHGAMPLLLGHGWPSTCFEFDRVIPLLAQDFHVVAPSLPGYAYSGVPNEAGWGVARTADAWVELMARLGYDQFLAHGGDWGAIITTELAIRRPETLLGLHLTLPMARATPAELEAAEAGGGFEADGVRRNRGYLRDGFGYATIQMARPQSLGHGLEDSPVGLLAWIGEKLLGWCGHDADGTPLLDDDAVLDVATTYWLTRTATSSARLYHEALRTDHSRPVPDVPVGCSIFPEEMIRPPRAAVERRYGPLVSWSQQTSGGHFPAAEVPDLFVSEVRAFAARLAEPA